MNITEQVSNGIKLIHLHGNFNDVINYVDTHPEYQCIFCNNYSTGAKATLTDQTLQIKTQRDKHQTTYVITGPKEVVQVKIDSIKDEYPPGGYGTWAKIEPLENGMVSGVVTRSNCCD